ncbi:MAG: hypothetical protein ACLVA6_06370 [Dorea sp.]|uniref:hypothetical protein n=1 Tax=Ruminococcus sp. TaxID=41978 RepID=UPI003991C24C
MQKKILEVRTPIVSAYPDLAHLFSILVDNKKCEKWIYNYFIQMEIYNTLYEETPRLDFYKPFLWESCPFIQQQIIEKVFLNRLDISVINFIEKSICDNEYILIDIDHFEVKDSCFYKNKHVIHKVLIYGYDKEQKKLYIGDYFENYKYGFKEMNYRDFLKAYVSCEQYIAKDIESSIRKYGIRIIKTEFDNDYIFDWKFLKNSFIAYIQGTNLNKYYKIANIANRDNWSNGIKTYNILKKYIEDLCKLEKSDYYPFRTFQVLYEHKKLMYSRVIFLTNEKYITKEECVYDFEKIKVEAEKIRNLFLIYYLKPKKEYLIKVRKNLEILQNNEGKAIKKLCENLNRYSKNIDMLK